MSMAARFLSCLTMDRDDQHTEKQWDPLRWSKTLEQVKPAWTTK